MISQVYLMLQTLQWFPVNLEIKFKFRNSYKPFKKIWPVFSIAASLIFTHLCLILTTVAILISLKYHASSGLLSFFTDILPVINMLLNFTSFKSPPWIFFHEAFPILANS